MKCIIIGAFLCTSLIAVSYSQITPSSCKRSASFQVDKINQRLTSGIILEKQVPSLFTCNAACTVNDQCESVNFQAISTTGKHMCEFIRRQEEEGKTWESNEGWFHYELVEKVINRCRPNTCPLSHVCEETCENSLGYKCVSDHCHNSPCQNNGTCISKKDGYFCECVRGYDGVNCESAETCNSGCTTPVCSSLGIGTVLNSQGNTGRTGTIQTYNVPKSGNYVITVAGAKGGTHVTNYGDYPGTFCGGNGALMSGTFYLTSGTILNVVVGHRGGDSVEVKGGQVTTQTATALKLSIEDNAGTGGGGGSFVYTSSNVLLIAAGGGGGATSGWYGVHGSRFENGTDSEGKTESRRGRGGSNGQAGNCCNTGSYHGGVGAGWSGTGAARAGASHGERGCSKELNWIGGQAGKMNSGNNGGPAPGAVGGFGGGGGGSEDNGASGAGGGYSGGGAGTHSNQAGGGGGSYCNRDLSLSGTCDGDNGGNKNHYGYVIFRYAT